MGTYVISDSVIVLEKCDGLCVNVFLPITDERQKVFQGVTFDLQALSTRYNATFRYMDQLPAYLGSDATIYSPSVQSLIDINLKPVIGDLSKRKLDVVYSKQLEQLFIESRFIKTQEEVEGIFYASQVAALSHSRLEKDIEKKYGESVLAKRFELYSTECGAILQAYNPIVGSGPHGAVLHYPTGESEDQGMAPLEKDEFVLVDAAGQWNGYASDLTRTYATSWTPKMRLIHSIVSLAQSKGIAAHYEGNKFSSLIEITLDTLLLGLMKAQLVIGDFESLKQSQVVKLFMPHGVGHPIGLDTHDPKPESVASDYKIAKGMVHTVEPGIYFIPFLLDLHKNNATSPWHNLVDWTKVDEYRGIGGVRIEDVVAIDPATGKNRILTRL
ncbi:peptidase M24, structural domain-containing protein [Gorgonomyces haynaldii]|nr:peptidase M24, structural domain-containing protein [Gorgonomyces haynaldii]